MSETLREILDAAGRDVFPPADGSVTIVRRHAHRDAGAIAFTAHSVVFTDENPGWLRETLRRADCDALATAVHPRFRTALMDRAGRANDTIDLLAVAAPLPAAPASRRPRSPAGTSTGSYGPVAPRRRAGVGRRRRCARPRPGGRGAAGSPGRGGRGRTAPGQGRELARAARR